MARVPSAGLRSESEALIELVAAAQGDDGYLNSYYTVAQPGRRWTDLPQGRAVLRRPSHPGRDRPPPSHRRRSLAGHRPPMRRRHPLRVRPGPTREHRRPSRDRDGAGRAVPRDRRATPSRPGRLLPRSARARAHWTEPLQQRRRLPGPRAGPRGPRGRGPCGARAVSHHRRRRSLSGDGRGRAPAGADPAVARHGRWQALPHRWRRRPAPRPRRSASPTSCRAISPTRRRAARSPASCGTGACCWPPGSRASPTSSSARSTTRSSPASR